MPTNLPLLAALACINAETASTRGGTATLSWHGFRNARRQPRLRLADLSSRRQANDGASASRVLGLSARTVIGVPYRHDVPVPFDLVSMGLIACDAAPLPHALVVEMSAQQAPHFISAITTQLSCALDADGLLPLAPSPGSEHSTLAYLLDLFDPAADWWCPSFSEALGPTLTTPSRAARRAQLMLENGTPADLLEDPAASLLSAPMPDKCVVWLHNGVVGPVTRRTSRRHQPGRADAVAIVVNNNAAHPYDVLDIEASVTLTGELLTRGEWDALMWSTDTMTDAARAAQGQPRLTPQEWEAADVAYQAYKAHASAEVPRRQQMCRDVLTRLQHWLDGRGHHPRPGTPEHDELTARLRANAVQRGYSPEDAAALGADDLTPVGRPKGAANTKPRAAGVAASGQAAAMREGLEYLLASDAALKAVLAAIRADLDPMDVDHPARPILEGYVAAAEGEKPRG